MWDHSGTSDEALLLGFGLGDTVAATQLVRRYQQRLYGLAVSILGDRTLAGDVVQEAFVRAFRRSESYDARRGTVATWLLTITRNLSIDALRLRRAVPTDPAVLADSSPPDPADDFEDAVVSTAEAVRLKAALASLSPEHRRAVALASFYGRTAREVGEHESIPLGTAKTRIRDGLMKLRAQLVDAGVGE